MSKLDRLEEKWLRLGEDLREGRAQLAALSAAVTAKREEFEKVDAVRDLVRQGEGSSAMLMDQALDALEAKTEESTTERPTRAAMVLEYVYASPRDDGATAKQVAKALYKRGYGSGTNWKNFYSSVTVDLKRWLEKGALEVMVPLQGRRTRHFTRPRASHDTTMPKERVRPWEVPVGAAKAPAKNRTRQAPPSATVTVSDRHEPPPTISDAVIAPVTDESTSASRPHPKIPRELIDPPPAHQRTL